MHECFHNSGCVEICFRKLLWNFEPFCKFLRNASEKLRELMAQNICRIPIIFPRTAESFKNCSEEFENCWGVLSTYGNFRKLLICLSAYLFGEFQPYSGKFCIFLGTHFKNADHNISMNFEHSEHSVMLERIGSEHCMINSDFLSWCDLETLELVTGKTWKFRDEYFVAALTMLFGMNFWIFFKVVILIIKKILRNPK